MRNDVYGIFESVGITYSRDVDLRGCSSFRIGGVGAIGLYPTNACELNKCVSILKEEGVGYSVIGKGSNVLFGDGYIDRAFIFTEKMSALVCNDKQIYAEAGVTLGALSAFAAKHGLTGLEFARGIPGTVGGAIFMNAGAYGGAMSDVVISSTAQNTLDGSTEEISDNRFGYRHSIYMERLELICLSCKITLEYGDVDDISRKMNEFAVSRREKQPLNYPSAGSYFKRPEGYFAGKLIEDAGLKGMRVGDACISEKHAGFVVNLGNARASDVLALEERVREIVYDRFGVVLEREVRVIDK